MRNVIEVDVERNEIVFVGNVYDGSECESCINFIVGHDIDVCLTKDGVERAEAVETVDGVACYILDDATLRSAGEFTVTTAGINPMRFIVERDIPAGKTFSIRLSTDGCLCVRYASDTSGGGGTGGAVSWYDVLDKPSTFPPATHSHTAEDVGAAAAGHTHTATEIGAAAADHTHTAEDVGAAAADHTHTATEIGAIPTGQSTLQQTVLFGTATYAQGATITFRSDPEGYVGFVGRLAYVGIAQAALQGGDDAREICLSSISDISGGLRIDYVSLIGVRGELTKTVDQIIRVVITADGNVSVSNPASVSIGEIYGIKRV